MNTKTVKNTEEVIKKWSGVKLDNKTVKKAVKECIDILGEEADLNFLDVSKVTNMRFLFKCTLSTYDFNGDISQWDVSNVEDMSFMFENCQFNGDLSKWNVSNVWDMKCMFYESSFNQDISKWNVSNVTHFVDFCVKCPLEMKPEYLPAFK